mmetsp:Transcript_70167/g.164630  ORF Transcript_70167/g.164630 Transcript_70167/m.164630 type:complete len:241 (-) Transcript_70167:119-841(-)
MVALPVTGKSLLLELLLLLFGYPLDVRVPGFAQRRRGKGRRGGKEAERATRIMECHGDLQVKLVVRANRKKLLQHRLGPLRAVHEDGCRTTDLAGRREDCINFPGSGRPMRSPLELVNSRLGANVAHRAGMPLGIIHVQGVQEPENGRAKPVHVLCVVFDHEVALVRCRLSDDPAQNLIPGEPQPHSTWSQHATQNELWRVHRLHSACLRQNRLGNGPPVQGSAIHRRNALGKVLDARNF